MDKSVEESKSPKVVKKERLDEDINEFAETAMNELLGWYGYGNPREAPGSRSCRSHSNSSSGPESPKLADGCGWCGKSVDESNGLSSGSTIFCSELCFSQSRRANFKKNKTCDWCRHIRHTVSYVDFQDGASQLQFCSDKCLNQYKMHIFCRETRAHLEMHPHLVGEDTSSGLITPDLWMKNCKSPNSRSPSPDIKIDDSQSSPLPLISVAHPSKLLTPVCERLESKSPRIKINKRQRKRLPSTVTNFPKAVLDVPQDLRVRHSPIHFEQYEKIPTENNISETHHPLLLEPPPFPFHNYFQPPDPRFLHPPPFNPHNLPLPLRQQSSILPPVTIMVPYPVMIPIPVPIPIPLPLSSFLKAEALKKNVSSQSSQTCSEDINVEQSSQNEANKEGNKGDIIIEEESPVSTRPLRLRKRKVVEPKSKIVIKIKKSVSV